MIQFCCSEFGGFVEFAAGVGGSCESAAFVVKANRFS